MASVRTLDRGLRILDHVIADDKPLKLRDVADAFDIDRAMAFRFLQTLCEFGLLHKDARTKGYSPGGQFYSWMIRARQRLDIADTVRPFLREVVRRTEQSAHLGMLVDAQVLLIDFVPSENVISVKNRVGVLEPVYCTAIGKAIASQFPREERDRLIDGLDLVRYSPRTITDREAAKSHLAEVAKNGFAVDDGEFNELLACVAVPLRAPGASPALSIGVSLIRPVIADDHKIVGVVAEHLRAVAAEIEALLGRNSGSER
ncbi:MAG: IclR family transcriptional regulator [Bauldia sp.]|nr:IclR family transcriptional regulator [Bauldia sp.]